MRGIFGGLQDSVDIYKLIFIFLHFKLFINIMMRQERITWSSGFFQEVCRIFFFLFQAILRFGYVI